MRVSWSRYWMVRKVADALNTRIAVSLAPVTRIALASFLIVPIAFAAAPPEQDLPAPIPPDSSAPATAPDASAPSPSNDASASKPARDDSKGREGEDHQDQSKPRSGSAAAGERERKDEARIAPLPDERLGIRTAPLLLLSRPDVRGELAMTPLQTEAAEHAITDLYVQASRLAGKPNDEVLSLRRALITAQVRWIEANLTDEQKTRLVQIDLQWEGPSSLVSRPLVAQTLKLTAEQRERISKAVVERERSRKEHGPRLEDERKLAVVALETLAPDQREHWRGLLGKEFVPRLASKPATTEKK